MVNPALVRRGEEQRDRIVAFIRAFKASHGYAPSLHEIGDHVGIASTNAVRGHLKQLEKAGRIRLQRGIPRAIQIVGED